MITFTWGTRRPELEVPQPIVVLDLRGSDSPSHTYAQALAACDAHRGGVRLVLISEEKRVADARVNPATLDVHVQYAGVELPDPAWAACRDVARSLPSPDAVLLATSFAVRALDEDRRSHVLQVAPTPILTGVPCLTVEGLPLGLRMLAKA
ncbi:hypothetical protein [Deinococcus maricopensis]|uniref:Uncharacterized protein n=1 Tax=Deinococcus maricopensis (strain DSM 21211 / LMG 22137 / NRRL B-23946 / LB-34) TaxID=709986 RepID=E8U317_DEIML|nr:hypothetical protein [Deinococcus maricopensis]ADV65755.1 hypothetical protein Deima_0091 [Deinococcus maricopensis DSM 21211]